jgi:hypothetical protein
MERIPDKIVPVNNIINFNINCLEFTAVKCILNISKSLLLNFKIKYIESIEHLKK